MQCNTVQYNTIHVLFSQSKPKNAIYRTDNGGPFNKVHYNTAQYTTIQYNTIQ